MFRRELTKASGQAFVELALVFPIFILLLVGAVEVGRLAYAGIEVSNAARAGVAYAAQNSSTATDITNITLAARQDAPDVTSLSAAATQSCSCETSSGTISALGSCSSAVTNLTSCPSPSRILQNVQVQTTANVATLFSFPGLPTTMTLRGYASMRVQQ